RLRTGRRYRGYGTSRRQLATIFSCRKRCKVRRMKTTIAGALVLAAAAGGLAPVRARDDAAGVPDTHATFTVGTATAQRGQRANGAIRVPAGVDAGYDIPVTVIHGARPGPVLAVVAGSHGSEYASIMAVEELMTTTTIDPSRMAGTLV